MNERILVILILAFCVYAKESAKKSLEQAVTKPAYKISNNKLASFAL